MNPADSSESALRYRRLFEAARDGILIVDPETRRIVDVNPFMIDFLGYPRDEFIGRELFEFGLMKDEAASQAAFRELQASGYIRYDDLPLETRTGQRVEVEFVSNLYHEGDRQVIQCNIRDITARKAAEIVLRSAEEKLARYAADLEQLVQSRTIELRLSNAQLETFVYSIAHDLRAPLRTMQGFSQLLVQDPRSALSPEGLGYARHIDRAAQTMDQLLTDLLAFSHISQRAIALAPIALNDAVRNALAACAPEIDAAHARIVHTSSPFEVLAHAPTLQQVLVNLLGNALKFVAGAIPRIQIHAELRPDGVVRLWIEDNGIGIPAEFRERIFQVFQRLHTTAYSGTGIGLSIVQKGMERMGGHVGLLSSDGQGSRFWIELAQSPASPVSAAAAAS